ncbi:MAG: GGDEF domain-containing protein [Syntrophobacteraceae bacterium]|jgi:diguanylate cyclase (GGDEF)-like protein
MESVKLLAQIVIDTLKEFSMEKRPLTAAALNEAFSTKKEILSLLSHGFSDPLNEQRKEFPNPQRQLKRIQLKVAEASAPSRIEPLAKLQSAFLKILHSFGPIIKGDYEKQFCLLQNKISDCDSLESLSIVGGEMDSMVSSLINDTVAGIASSNDFLADLSNDLYKMEEQLFSYQNYNRESYLLSNEFQDDLLLHTGDMGHALDVGNNLEDARHLITSKLSVIAKAVDVKRQEDEVRLLESDKKITELQNNVKTYNQEILQVRERADALEKEVLLDELTQVSNRRAYDLRASDTLRHYHRDGVPFSLLFIDIDHFKRVNDGYGHSAGDKCLREIAKLIRGSLRKTDFFARYGGEEFIAILNGSNAEDARSVAEKIRSRIENTRFSYHDEVIPVTISIGVAEVMRSDTDAEVCFFRADEALYQAKKDGRNRVHVILSCVQNPPCPPLEKGGQPSGVHEFHPDRKGGMEDFDHR